MPTYEYACSSCGETTEAVQSFSDPPLEECPHCGGTLKRVFRPVGIVLKGSGYYSTDNRSSKRPAEPRKESKEPTSSESSGSSGSDAKGASGSSGSSSGDGGSKATAAP